MPSIGRRSTSSCSRMILGVREKVENGDATKEDIIAWLKEHAGYKTDDKKKKDYKKSHNFPDTAYEYAKMVESELRVPPKVDLDKSVEIPIYVDGVQKYGNLGLSCDNPTRLGKETISGSVPAAIRRHAPHARRHTVS